MRFRDAIRNQISSPRPILPTDSLVMGITAIMREYHSYRLEHFFGKNAISSAQFFGLIGDIINRVEREQEQMKKSEKKTQK